METVVSLVGAGSCCHSIASVKGLGGEIKRRIIGTQFNNSCSFGSGVDGLGRTTKPKRMVVVRADVEPASINPDIRKSEEKVVDSVVVTELSKPLTAYCRYETGVGLRCHEKRANPFFRN